MPKSSVTVTPSKDVTIQAEQQQQHHHQQMTSSSRGITDLPPSGDGVNWTTKTEGQVWGPVDKSVWTLGDSPWIPAVLVVCGMAVLLSLSFYSHHKRVRRRRELLMDYLSTLLYSGVFTRGRSVSFLCNTNSMALADLGGSFKIKDDRVYGSSPEDQVMESDIRDWITFSKGDKKRKKGLKRFVSHNKGEPNFRRVASQVFALNKTTAVMSWKGRVGFAGSLKRNLSMPLSFDSSSYEIPSSISEARHSITKGVLLDPSRVQQQDFDHNLVGAEDDEIEHDANLHPAKQPGWFDLVNMALNSPSGADSVGQYHDRNQELHDQAHSWKSKRGHSDDQQTGSYYAQNEALSYSSSVPNQSVPDPNEPSAVLQANDEVIRDRHLRAQLEMHHTPPHVHNSALSPNSQSKLVRSKKVSKGSFRIWGDVLGKEKSEKSAFRESSLSAKDVSVSVTQSSALLPHKYALRPMGNLRQTPSANPTQDPRSHASSSDVSAGNDAEAICRNETGSLEDDDSSAVHVSGTDCIRRPCDFPRLSPWRTTKSNVKLQHQHPYCALRPEESVSYYGDRRTHTDSQCAELTFCSSEVRSAALSLDMMNRKIPYLVGQEMQLTYTKSLEDGTNRSPRRYPLLHRNEKSTEYAPLLPGEKDSNMSDARTFFPPISGYCAPRVSRGAAGSSGRLPVFARNPSTTDTPTADGSVTSSNDLASFTSDKNRFSAKTSHIHSSATSNANYRTSPDIVACVNSDPVSQAVPQRSSDPREKPVTPGVDSTQNNHRTLHRLVFNRNEKQQAKPAGERTAERKQDLSWQAPPIVNKDSPSLQSRGEPEAFPEGFSAGGEGSGVGRGFSPAAGVPLDEVSFTNEDRPEQHQLQQQQQSNLYRLPRFQFRSGLSRHHENVLPPYRDVEDQNPTGTQEQQPPQLSADGRVSLWNSTPMDTSI